VLREAGALDLGDAARLRDALQSAFTASDGDVVVDLTQVEFLDSVILSVFVTVHKRFAASDRTLTFLVPPGLFRLFELTGLVRVLDVRVA
jgi:anti-anti-sigma factor